MKNRETDQVLLSGFCVFQDGLKTTVKVTISGTGGSPYSAEVYAIGMACREAIEYNYEKIIIQTDCQRFLKKNGEVDQLGNNGGEGNNT